MVNLESKLTDVSFDMGFDQTVEYIFRWFIISDHVDAAYVRWFYGAKTLFTAFSQKSMSQLFTLCDSYEMCVWFRNGFILFFMPINEQHNRVDILCM